MNHLHDWTTVLYTETSPLFVIQMDTWQIRQFQQLGSLPFSQSLQIVIASVPQLGHQHWHEFQQLAGRYVPESRLNIWQQIGNTMRRILPHVWEMLNDSTFPQAVNCAKQHLCKGSDLDQFAFMACLYYFQRDNVTAQMLLAYLLQQVEQDNLSLKPVLSFYQRLTPRQRDVVQLTAQGYTNQEIAEKLVITSAVVAEHLTAIYAEFQNALNLQSDKSGTRYRLIHWMTRLYQQHPEFLINLNR